jgi:hypothetical protein
MARADIANGERPEQPVSREHAEYDRRRAPKHPIGEQRAETHRTEESPS